MRFFQSKFITSVISLLMLPGCIAAATSAINAPSKLFGNYNSDKGITFAINPELKLDIYTPSKKVYKGLRPVIFFVYGGGWTDGAKHQYPFIGDAFASKGYVVVIADYRKYPEVKYPEFLNDSAKAFAWTYFDIHKYNGDRENITVMGHSAGAYNGAMLAINERFLQELGLPSNAIKAFVGISGPYNFTPEEEKFKQVFSHVADDYTRMHANTFLNGDEPPMLLVHGDDDDIVSVENAYVLQKGMKEWGGIAEVKTYEGEGHLSIMAGMARPFKGSHAVFNDIISWLETYKAKLPQ